MYALGERTIPRRHLGDAVEDRLQPVGLLGALLALGAQLRGALLHRGALSSSEAVGLGLGTVRGHSHAAFRHPGLGAVPAIGTKARPATTATASRFVIEAATRRRA